MPNLYKAGSKRKGRSKPARAAKKGGSKRPRPVPAKKGKPDYLLITMITLGLSAWCYAAYWLTFHGHPAR